ncbi:MAG TPA: uroporphyrinogen-III synthase, partial [Pseudorhizobium sp.]|nr:uroporphyrinogen-III synthase [Pseudorhizobium sp.]
MRVLVTRPQQASHSTAEKLRALGHQPVLLPVTRPEHHPDDVLEGLRHPHAAIAITSAEAVRVLRSLDVRLQPYLNDPVFAVGGATASAARAAGFKAVEAAEGTAASMITMFGDRLRRITADSPLLYVAGHPRGPTFEDGLARLGIPFTTIEGYWMKPLAVDEATISAALNEPPVDGVLLYSRATAAHFFDLTSTSRNMEVLHRTRILCLSPNVAEAVPAALKARV